MVISFRLTTITSFLTILDTPTDYISICIHSFHHITEFISYPIHNDLARTKPSPHPIVLYTYFHQVH